MNIYEPLHEKTNIVDSAQGIDPDQPKHTGQADKDKPFCLLRIFCFMNHYSIPLSPRDGMFRSGLACVDRTGWSGSIRYLESVMLVFVVEQLMYGCIVI